MKIVVVTQNENFYLYEFFELFLATLSDSVTIDCFILEQQNPFGRRATFVKKMLITLNTFGIRFCIRFFIRLLIRRLSRRTVVDFLTANQIAYCEGVDVNGCQFHKYVEESGVDLVVSVAGAQIFKEQILTMPRHGIVNLHTSNLPKYRGLMPCFWALLAGEERVGISVFQVDEGIDSGRIFKQESIAVETRCLESVIKRTKTIGAVMLAEVVNEFSDLGYADSVEQDHAGSTYFSFPQRSDIKKFLAQGNQLW